MARKPRIGIIAGLDCAINIQGAEKQRVLACQKREQREKTQIAGGLIGLWESSAYRKNVHYLFQPNLRDKVLH